MIAFSSITAEEFLRLNESSIPVEILKYFEDFSERIKELQKELQKEVQRLERSEELAWEQVSFARDLVQQLDKFAEQNLSKAKMKVYNQIRENTYFEI